MNILTLDAGGTNFVFTAVINNKIINEKIKKPAIGNNLDLCLKTIIEGFREIKQIVGTIEAISFAFPGPADYKKGIIGNLNNLPCFCGGVALASMLENFFQVPVFINNDGDLYAYGEALAGSLPEINKRLKEKNNSKRYNNLIGMTIGTGFGAGLVSNKQLIKGDNVCAAEIWLTSNRVDSKINTEEAVSIRAIKYFYSFFSNTKIEDCPEPKEIYEIASNENHLQNKFAKMAFEQSGRFIGDAIANMITLFDGIVVIGGGIAAAKNFIIPGIKKELKTNFNKLGKTETNPRVTNEIYCLNDEKDYEKFLEVRETKIKIPYSEKEIIYDMSYKNAYLFSNFDTSEMICLGAYNFAVENLFL